MTDHRHRHRLCRIDAAGQPVDHHVPDVLLDDFGRVVMRGERMPVGHEEITGILRLQAHPVLDGAMVVAQMKRPRGAHAGNNAFLVHGSVQRYLKKGGNQSEDKNENGRQHPA